MYVGIPCEVYTSLVPELASARKERHSCSSDDGGQKSRGGFIYWNAQTAIDYEFDVSEGIGPQFCATAVS